jgi:hypothetical protein
MAVDQNLYTIEQRLVTAAWLHETPRKATMLGWEKRVFATGSVKHRPRGGRPITGWVTCHAAAASVTQFPVKSTRKGSAELGIPRSTMMDHMKLDLKVRLFHPLHVNELSDADMNARKDACRALLAALRSQCARGAVLFTDE